MHIFPLGTNSGTTIADFVIMRCIAFNHVLTLRSMCVVNSIHTPYTYILWSECALLIATFVCKKSRTWSATPATTIQGHLHYPDNHSCKYWCKKMSHFWFHRLYLTSDSCDMKMYLPQMPLKVPVKFGRMPPNSDLWEKCRWIESLVLNRRSQKNHISEETPILGKMLVNKKSGFKL